ncbi:C39 family peptidase [Nocardioides sp. T2.26MG-1]|uniref:C39 family peptidase n=1 Tax=Nocardioides sp. T2.26MG-1 TaxID=3041166 RepID=UPI00247790ED|nr:C39 family peptidase [Nocardioides sp. T2.26MG-1]CAI9411991.1 hypothetical protein HIDPHFAB_01656 [Nocardioides sp. T2.26MG-1]
MSRRSVLAVAGTLVVLLALTPLIPRGEDDGAIVPSDGGKAGGLRPAATAGWSEVTPQMQAEIDRVVAAGRTLGRVSGRTTPEQLASSAVRCAELEGQRYCLGAGWTEDSEAEVRARMARSARTAAARPAGSTGATESTGDLDPVAALDQRVRMSPADRAAADRAELTMAARSVAKVWLLRHEIEGVPLPVGFLADHPEARAALPAAARTSASTTASPTTKPSASASASATPSQASVKTMGDYPERVTILDPTQVSEQIRTYWCGPTSMQMIAWGWRDRRQTQGHWARRLNTTGNGTSVYDMVRVVNQSTGWDNEDHAGPYIVLDIGKYSFRQWMLLMMRHLADYKAPVVLHPILLKQFYPYLDDDASGHFQVGRGYAKRGDKPDVLNYFEPWNQHRFDPSEPSIARVQWRSAYKSYRGNQAHYAHNVGV